ncbi:energy-dependent translational throttle protein EttA, partial [Pseudoalteromonas aliena]
PVLDESKTVSETVEEGVGEVKHALKRLVEVYNEYAMEDADFDALSKEQGELEAVILAHDGHNIDNVLERAA